MRSRGGLHAASVKQKNIKKMRWHIIISTFSVMISAPRNAMVLSYHHQDGYLPPKEVANLSLAYSTVYHLGFDQGLIVSAINDARSMDIRHGMVNISKFIQYITDNHE